MKISTCAIAYMLAKKYTSEENYNCDESLDLKACVLFDGSEPFDNYLYIVDEKSNVRHAPDYNNCAYIFCNTQQNDSHKKFKSSDTIHIKEDIDANILLREVFEIFNVLQKWDCNLKDAQYNNTDMVSLLSIARDVLTRPYMLSDSNLAVIAASEHYYTSLISFSKSEVDKNFNRIPPIQANEMLMDEEFKHIAKIKGPFLYPSYPCLGQMICYNIMKNDIYIGRITSVLAKGEEVSLGEKYLLSIFAGYVQNVFLSNAEVIFMRSQRDSLHGLCKKLILQKESVSDIKAEKILESYNWKNQDLYSVVKISFIEITQFENSSNYLLEQLEREAPNSCAIKQSDSIVWIINHSKADTELEFYQFLSYMLRDYTCKAGISLLFNGFNNCVQYLKQADVAMEIGERKDAYIWCYRFEKYVIDYMLEQISSEFVVDDLYHVGLKKLILHDKKNKTEYVNTLFYYIKYKYNISEAADKLYVHRTTFIRRLERIKEISDINLDDYNELFHIMLSYKLIGM